MKKKWSNKKKNYHSATVSGAACIVCRSLLEKATGNL